MARTSASQNGKASDDISVQDLSEQVQILKDDIATLTSSLQGFVKGKGVEAAEGAKDQAAQAAEELKSKAMDAQDSAENFIRTQPAVSLGLAAGVGFLIGMLTARR